MGTRIINSPTIMGGRFLIEHLREERRSAASSESAELIEKVPKGLSRG